MARIEKIKIQNFKSHKKYSLNLEKNLKHIIVYGKNGIGKTNLLDSFTFFSNTKGLRGSSLSEIYPVEETNKLNTKVQILLTSKNDLYNFSYEIICDENKLKKIVSLDNKNTSIQEIKNYINFVWLSPYMDKIMYEGQTLKRNFIDNMISQNEKCLSKSIITFKKYAQERLEILKKSKDRKWLDIIEGKIAEKIYEVFNIRRVYAEEINRLINIKLNKFRAVQIEFENDLYSKTNDTVSVLNLFIKKLKELRHLDEVSKRTNFGINSDQVIFVDKKNNLNTDICSTGEQKSCLLTIILANCWKLKNNNNDFILLLDEATSHIDELNFEKLFNEVDKFDTQIWYTGINKKMFQVIENKGFFIHLD